MSVNISGGSYYMSNNDDDDRANSSSIKCLVLMLDGSQETFNIPKKACGQCLLDLIFDTLELLERDFFGLQFKDSHPSSGKFNRWLNSSKPIRKQLPGAPPYNFQFKIRFYPSNPNQMKEEYTRYLLYLQLKKDLLEDRLYCSKDMVAILTSYGLQSELGNYSPELHKPGYAALSHFLKPASIRPDLEHELTNLHAARKNMSPIKAELEFLLISSQQSYYGVDIFNALSDEKELLQIGPSSLGFNVFQHKQRIHLFSWTNIFKISFKKKRICVQIKSLPNQTGQKAPVTAAINDMSSYSLSTRFCYSLSSFPLCKTMWQNCVDYHVFYRLRAGSSHQNTIQSSSTDSVSSGNPPSGGPRHSVFAAISRTPSAFAARRTMPFIDESNSHRRRFVRDTENVEASGSISPTSTVVSRDCLNGGSKSVYNARKLPPSVTNTESVSSNSYLSRHERSHSKSFSSLSGAANPNRDIREDIRAPIFARFDSDDDDEEDNGGRVGGGDGDSLEGYDNARTASRATVDTGLPPTYRSNMVVSVTSGGCGGGGPRLLQRLRSMNKSLDETSASSSSTCIQRSNASMDSLSEKMMDSRRSNPHSTSPLNGYSVAAKAPKRSGVSSAKTVGCPDEHLLLLVDVQLYPEDRGGRYGFTIKLGPPLFINNIARNSPADLCYPRLSVGDQIVAIGAHNVTGATQEEAIALVRKCAETDNGLLKLTIRPSNYMVECEPAVDNQRSMSDHCSTLSRDSCQSRQAVTRAALVTNDNNFSASCVAKMDMGLSKPDSSLRRSMRSLVMALKSDDLVQQFKSIYRSKPGFTMNHAKKTENFVKNRYRDISPYDQTRVILKSIDNFNDYINASVVNMPVNNSSTCEVRYIAAQGPMSHTVDDFWRMCWQQDCRLVVMLTSLSEGGRPKCHQYWPPLYETVEFCCQQSADDNDLDSAQGSIQVSCLSEETEPGVIVRDLVMYRTGSGSERRIRHLQYAGWPDHGVPSNHDEFLTFVHKVRSCRRNPNTGAPVVVHCSAGIGRTGVLITMETALCLMEAGLAVQPMELLRTMRDQRASMIQTPAQFVFVCEAILKVYRESYPPETTNL